LRATIVERHRSESVEGATEIGSRGPVCLFVGIDGRVGAGIPGSGGTGVGADLQRAGANRLDDKSVDRAIDIGLVALGQQVGQGDFHLDVFAGALGGTGEGGQRGRIVHLGDGDGAGGRTGLHAVGTTRSVQIGNRVCDSPGGGCLRGPIAGAGELHRPEHGLVVGYRGAASEGQNTC